MASLLNDGPLFFPNVLTDQTFQQRGILWGTDPYGAIGLHWAVIDPRRHKMYVWEKRQEDFVQAAYSLAASVFSNGSFNRYRGGNKYLATLGVGVVTIAGTMLSKFHTILDLEDPTLNDPVMWYKLSAATFFSARLPYGRIYGAREGIAIQGIPRPNLHHFGRKLGRFFADYEIGLGSPLGPTAAGGFTEVIGSLFRTVENYSAVEPHQRIGAGHYGLAPFVNEDGTIVDDEPLRQAGIDGAILEYHEKEELYATTDTPSFQPPVNGAPLCEGLILTAYYWGEVATVAQLLVSARVKDAVRVDGNSSILLGHGTTAVVGGDMPDVKRRYNKWGYQFQAE